jgi:hypothetical protein
MQINDIINGSIELIGGILLISNIIKILKDKEVKGIHWSPVMFFTIWGIWNLYYYPSLDQWFSFIGGCLVVLVNTIWLILVFYYKNKKTKIKIMENENKLFNLNNIQKTIISYRILGVRCKIFYSDSPTTKWNITKKELYNIHNCLNFDGDHCVFDTTRIIDLNVWENINQQIIDEMNMSEALVVTYHPNGYRFKIISKT